MLSAMMLDIHVSMDQRALLLAHMERTNKACNKTVTITLHDRMWNRAKLTKHSAYGAWE